MSTRIKNTNNLFDDQYPGRDLKEVKATWMTHVYAALLAIVVAVSFLVPLFIEIAEMSQFAWKDTVPASLLSVCSLVIAIACVFLIETFVLWDSLRNLEQVASKCHNIHDIAEHSLSPMDVMKYNEQFIGKGAVGFVQDLRVWINAWFRFKFTGGLFQQQYVPVPFVSRWLALVEFIEPLYFWEQFNEPIGYDGPDVKLAALDIKLSQLQQQSHRPYFRSLKICVIKRLTEVKVQFEQNMLDIRDEIVSLEGCIYDYQQSICIEGLNKASLQVLQIELDRCLSDKIHKTTTKETALKISNWAMFACSALIEKN